MGLRIARILVLLCCFTSAALSQVKVADTCSVQADPSSYDGKIVTLHGKVVAGFEVFAVGSADSKCLLWLEYAGGGPTASVSIGSQTPNLARPAVVLRQDGNFKRFSKLLDATMYSRDRGDICMDCRRYEVSATMTGRVDVAPRGSGFGHMNGFPIKFVLSAVADVAAKDLSSGYDLTKFSPTPVHLPTAVLSGKVVGPNGKPIEDAEISALSTKEVPAYLEEFTEWTDEKGRYKIEVPPGTYVVGINLTSPPSARFPYAATYSPNTTEKDNAHVITVVDGQHLALPIRVGKRLPVRKIPVKVVWPDGKPVEMANVWLAEKRNPTAVVGSSVSHTDSKGKFELIGFTGIAYFLHSNIYVKPGFRPFCAEKMDISETNVPANPIEMTLTISGDICRKRD